MIRHRLANAFYRLARWLDQPVTKVSFGSVTTGTVHPRNEWKSGGLRAELHGEDPTPVSTTFIPPNDQQYQHVTAWLKVGTYDREITVFMTRRLTERMISCLRGLEASFKEYGEGDRL